MRCNEQIRITPVRLIGQNNEQIGIVETVEALKTARDAGLDLVEVAANVRPPVCRIMDYGKWKYRQKKHQKKHHEQQLKEVRIRPKTDDHDLSVKLNRALNFFRKGDKVQFTMMFRGRERAHREIGFDIFHGLIKRFGESVKVERSPSMDGRHMIMILAPVKGAFDDSDEGEKARQAKDETEQKTPTSEQNEANVAGPAASGVAPPPGVSPERSDSATTPAESTT